MSQDWRSDELAQCARALVDETSTDPNRQLAREYARLFLDARSEAMRLAPLTASDVVAYDVAVARHRLGPLLDRALELRAQGCSAPDVERGLRADFPAANEDDLDAAVYEACGLSPNQARSRCEPAPSSQGHRHHD